MIDVTMRTRSIREEVSQKFFIDTGRTYDRVVAITTFGLDRHWKRKMMKAVPRGSGRILDLACGTGIVLAALHRRCPKAALVGVDFTRDYLDVAEARHRGKIKDLTLIHSNAEEMELDGTFDTVVSSYIPKYCDPDILLARLTPHVRPGTRLVFHDFAYPRGLPRFIWRRWMRTLAWLGPKVWPAWEACFDANLEELIATGKWHRTYAEALKRHGWTEVKGKKLSWRTAYMITARKA